MTKKYTAADFANARFAEHPDGGLATRSGGDYYTWEVGGTSFSTDELMARYGWVPVPTKPTLTESEFEDIKTGWGKIASRAWLQGFARAGGEIIPDPEPTDEELLAGIIRNIDDWQSITSPELLAKYLNTAGVTPPKEDN